MSTSVYGVIWCLLVSSGVYAVSSGVILCREMVRDICAAKRVELSEEELDQSAQDNWK